MKSGQNDFDERAQGCGCPKSGSSRRDFLTGASVAVLAALVAAGARADSLESLRVVLVDAAGAQGSERSYPIPSTDGVSIDPQNQVIIVRYANHMFAFSLACPHENTELRWRPQDQRFQCPRHQSKYQPDGAFISGRATRNMDRFAVRRDGNNMIVDLARLYRSDQQSAEWTTAVVSL
jgi:nitrite reductase/ring-hydroxylating ferredoxin subunit